ncbi:BcPIC2 [Coleophoma cylindrospora]|uniref:BcPIC2 n=1 Tax=Coleophoma cylindrospora TaxID=1849047 RepID=A0A3D8S8Y9_9HELO|nr:BcPIC2 [Coleophoma cylindrospora]
MQPTTALRMFQPSKRMMRPVPKEEHSAHTISQRLRQWRKVPPELLPLGLVVCVALGFAGYSLGKKLVVDKQMRLTRKGGQE